MLATDGTERDPVAVYKSFARKRPEVVNNTIKPGSLARKKWLVQVRRCMLNGSMKTVVQEAGIQNDTLLDI